MDFQFFLFKFILIYAVQNSLEVTKKENQDIGRLFAGRKSNLKSPKREDVICCNVHWNLR
jgi:hypothetical protein